MLLLGTCTILPVPEKWQSDKEELPGAMRFLTLLGLLDGLAVFGTCLLLAHVHPVLSATIMLAVHLLFGGLHALRDVVAVADGEPPRLQRKIAPRKQSKAKEQAGSAKAIKRRVRMITSYKLLIGKAGVLGGLVWLAATYIMFLVLTRIPQLMQIAFLAAPVIARLLQAWSIWFYAALPPAHLHRGFGKLDFLFSFAPALVVIILVSRGPLYAGLVVAFLGVCIFSFYRVNSFGGLDDYCYGANYGWAEALFYLSWIAFLRLF